MSSGQKRHVCLIRISSVATAHTTGSLCVRVNGGCLLVGSNLLDDEDPQCSEGGGATALHQCNHDCGSLLSQQRSQTLSHLLSLLSHTLTLMHKLLFLTSLLTHSLPRSLSLSRHSITAPTHSTLVQLLCILQLFRSCCPCASCCTYNHKHPLCSSVGSKYTQREG